MCNAHCLRPAAVRDPTSVTLRRASRLTTPTYGCDAAVPRAETKSGSETILLVEDDVAVRELVQRVLSRHGYTLVVAAPGKEALQLTTTMSRTIDLLLTDAVMPGISGPSLAVT